MKGKIKLRAIQILCIMSLSITILSIQRTYAKYFEKVDTTYATNIKKWVINVNEKNLHRETTLTNVMTPEFFYNPNMNSNEGLNDILVPGREGYFDFLIDYSKVDVAFKFEFDIKQLNATILEDFEVFGYKIIETDAEITSTTKLSDIGEITTLTKDAQGKYQLSGITQQIDPTLASDTQKQKRILILFRWNDDNADTEDNMGEPGMNNEEDTKFTGIQDGEELHKLLKYNVKITFTQLF